MDTENKPQRLAKIAAELNVGISSIVDFLAKKGHKIDSNPNSKVPFELMPLLRKEFSDSVSLKEQSNDISQRTKERKAVLTEVHSEPVKPEHPKHEVEDKELLIKDSSGLEGPKIVGKINLDELNKPVKKPVEPAKTTTAEPEAKKVEPAKISDSETEKKADDSKTEKKSPKIVGTIDLDSLNQKTRPDKKKKSDKKTETPEPVADEPTEAPVAEEQPIVVETPVAKEDEPNNFIETKYDKLTGPSVIGKINIDDFVKKEEDIRKKRELEKVERKQEREKEREQKKKRKRIRKETVKVDVTKNKEQNKFKPKETGTKKKPQKEIKPEVSDELVQKQIKETLARLTSTKQKSKTSKYRREKRDIVSQRIQAEIEETEAQKNILKVTEFVSVNELASMIQLPVTEVIATCMNLGLFVSINQRLDAETMALVADEFGYKVEFVSAEVLSDISDEVDDEEELQPRPPIVTVMGHVDHGKTKLLDYIRHTNVVAGEAGGITQHIGAYSVVLDSGKQITFLDTPGHEAFTAMRARGAQITDIAIIVVAADDDVMPQTVEAINHASAAGVPMVFAINKIDKPNANPEKIKEQLANMNYLIEEWGGKYQSQDISAKQGLNVDQLLEKVLLEAELLDLKANPNKRAIGTVVESALDKGKGYTSTILVQSGTLHIGDIILAGSYTGRVKAMFNERGLKIDTAGPSKPVLVLGISGAPQAGDKFNVMETEHEAKAIANKRLQLQREQGLRTQKYITLDEIGRRLALGNFHEIKLIVKGDVDGSIEALSDSLIKLSNEEVQVSVIHKAVGQISESDVMLAAASDAIIIGFQVRPSIGARRLAEKEQIDIRLYSIIYDAINEIKDAMEGMLSPEIKEKILGAAIIKEVFKITKVGTVAGCIVTEGKILRTARIRLIRDGIVVYTGELGSLKRFKDDAKEVVSGLECGLNIENYNDMKVDDVVEAFEEFEIKKKL
ncbi:MAG: translation initiation factor IF-2 [Bacteroidales bacterium]|nr:translation initiation factor IF-2 [Bacteroidales bacterium]HOY37778.1 translation initiation factor IF-2 [Bacteroidales bacterium]HQP02959.1 translation initiation factor IF-2 [Bacteroidales bacterium]